MLKRFSFYRSNKSWLLIMMTKNKQLPKRGINSEPKYFEPFFTNKCSKKWPNYYKEYNAIFAIIQNHK